jgi:hypothetical protein
MMVRGAAAVGWGLIAMACEDEREWNEMVELEVSMFLVGVVGR